jgi:hypothetical protein
VRSVENGFAGLRYGLKSLSTLAFQNNFLELIMPSEHEKPSNVLKQTECDLDIQTDYII